MPRLRDIDKGELFGGKKKPTDKAPMVDLQALEEELESLEKDMNELKSQYELFFMGVERQEPHAGRDGIRSRLRRIKEVQHNNTALKFKFQMLQARMVSLETYWGRVMRQREEGTYKRDIDKVKRHQAELDAKNKTKGKDGTDAKDPKAAEAAAAAAAPGSAAQRAGTAIPAASAPTSAPPARPSAARATDLDDGALRQLYQTYVTAKRRCGEQVDLKYDEMASSLRKQVPKLLESTGAKSIEFKVVIKSGHAVLKAVPKT